MQRFNIFIDESGQAIPNLSGGYFTVCGLVSSNDSRERLRDQVGNLKQKYFKRKNYVLHSVNLTRHLKTAKRIEAFAQDLDKILAKNNFFLLYVVVDLEKSFRWSWQKQTILKKVYRLLISNLIIFLVAKDAMGRICSEASSVEQDIIIYQSFFHYVAHGIERLSISPADVKRHLTEVSFVTKINNDAEEQLADIFSICAKFRLEVERGEREVKSFTPITRVLMRRMEERLFVGLARKTSKKKLYKEMRSFVLVP